MGDEINIDTQVYQNFYLADDQPPAPVTNKEESSDMTEKVISDNIKLRQELQDLKEENVTVKQKN